MALSGTIKTALSSSSLGFEGLFGNLWDFTDGGRGVRQHEETTRRLKIYFPF